MTTQPHFTIPDTELRWSFVRSGGPGGQNVNKVASKVCLRWNVLTTKHLPEDVLARLRVQQTHRINSDGELIITSDRTRDQVRNREDCLAKLFHAVERARVAPTPRIPTRPTRGSQRQRLADKRHRALVKANRRQLDD